MTEYDVRGSGFKPLIVQCWRQNLVSNYVAGLLIATAGLEITISETPNQQQQ